MQARALLLWGSSVGVDLSSIARFAPLVAGTLAQLDGSDRELALELKAQTLQAMFAAPDCDLEAVLGAEARRLEGVTPGEAKMLGIYILRRVLEDVGADEIADLARRAMPHADALIAAAGDTLALTGVVLGLHWTDRLDAEERLVTRARWRSTRARRPGSRMRARSCRSCDGAAGCCAMRRPMRGRASRPAKLGLE